MYLLDIFKLFNPFVMIDMAMKKFGLSLGMLWMMIMFSNGVMAQNAKFKMADAYYRSFDYVMSGNIYRDIVSNAKYANDTTALRRLAIGELALGKWVEAEGYYNQLIKLDKASISDYVTLADIQKRQGRYADALRTYEKILTINPNHDIAKRHMDKPDFALTLKEDSMIYRIKNSDINSSSADFGVGFFTKDKVIFSSSRGNNKKEQRLYSRTDQPYLNIYTADITADSSLKNVDAIQGKINSRYHEGSMAYSPGEDLVYFTRNNYINGTVSKSKQQNLNLGIYMAKYNAADNTWSDISAFPYNNAEYSVGHPCFSRSGTRIYFVSDMEGGIGGTDIYYCDKKDNAWSTPVNAGNKINTSGNEMFPFLVNDSLLYFSSNGHVGLGGLDVFFTNPLTDDVVINAGYPASTAADDFAYICYPNEIVGYFSSSRRGGKGDDDIYEFKIIPVDTIEVSGTVLDMTTMEPIAGVIVRVPAPDGSVVEVMTNSQGKYILKTPYNPEVTIEAEKKGYLKGIGTAKANPRSSKLERVDIKMRKYDAMIDGKVIYAENNAPAVGALIRLLEITSGDTTIVDSTRIAAKGTYQFPLFAKKNYTLIVTQEGYARQTASFSTVNPADKEFHRDFKLFKPKVGEVVRLDNIYYDYNSAVIRPDAALELNKLVQILLDNPTMKIELSSHSDSRGGDKYNLELSDKRAKSAVNYIISQGIQADRLYGKGYGELKILNHCKNDVKCTEDEHQFNRRTEFTITAF